MRIYGQEVKQSQHNNTNLKSQEIYNDTFQHTQ